MKLKFHWAKLEFHALKRSDFPRLFLIHHARRPKDSCVMPDWRGYKSQ